MRKKIAVFLNDIGHLPIHERLTVIAFGAVILALPFTYQPALIFGKVDGTNLKLSIAVAIVCSYVIVSLPLIVRSLATLRGLWLNYIFLALCLYVSIRVLGTANLTRGVFTASFLWMLFGVFLSVQATWPVLRNYWSVYRALLYGTTLIVCVFALWQVLADAAGLSELTLLPLTYQSPVFGFARPTGFSLEPQFLGSFLLVPIIISAYALLQKQPVRRIHLAVFAVATSVLILTLSRGAYIAAFISMICLFLYVRPPVRKVGIVCGILVAAGIAAFGVMGIAAQVNARDTLTGSQAVIRAVNHVSLGTITLEQADSPSHSSSSSPAPDKSDATPSKGYVEESTTSRLSMSEEALELWRQSSATAVFGIGTGGFGATLHNEKPEHRIESIVNNQYLETLVETGLIGLALLLVLLVYPVALLIRKPYSPIIAILVGLYVQWCFFSGSINVPHVWLLLAVAYALGRELSDRAENTARSRKS